MTLSVAFSAVILLMRLVGWLEFNVPFQHKYGYIRDETVDENDGKNPDCKKTCANYRSGSFRITGEKHQLGEPSSPGKWPLN